MEVYGQDEERRPAAGRHWTALVASVVVIAFLGMVSILPGGGTPRDTVAIGGGSNVLGGLPTPVRNTHPSANAVPADTTSPAPPNATSGAAGDASQSQAPPSASSSAAATAGSDTSDAGSAAGAPRPASVAAGSTLDCGPSDCVTVDASAPGAAFQPLASGLNLGVQAGDQGDAAATGALGVSSYRGAPTVGLLNQLDWTDWNAGARNAKSTTLVVSNVWLGQFGHPYPPTPWSNWASYKNWLAQFVQNVMASGKRVTYWEIYNEPGFGGYYSPQDFKSMTQADLLQQFLVSYNVIKSVDPGAQIVGPSTGIWSLTPLPASTTNHEFDLGTFLHFAAANKLKLAAIAWHDNGASPGGLENEAAATEALIRDIPGLGNPPMILQEYASQATQPIPGWDVAYLAAVQQAGFISAGRSCWQNACNDGELDGLLAPDGVAQTAEYWERLTYAQMKGRTVAVSSNDPTIAGLGAVDTGTRQVSVLLGRAASCAQQAWCDAEFAAGSHPAASLPAVVRVHLPWSSPATSVRLTTHGFQLGVVPAAPASVAVNDASVAPAAGGGEWVSFPVPAWADGAAYGVSISG